MVEMANRTPFAILTEPCIDAQGRHAALVVVKGVWRLSTGRLADDARLLAPRSSPLLRTIGALDLEPAQRAAVAHRLDEMIEWLPADNLPFKPRFDLVVVGHAWAPQGRAQPQLAATVQRGQRQVTLLAFGPRCWQPRLLSHEPGPVLAPVRRVPVHPAFAFGGVGEQGALLDNPIGMGGLRQQPDAPQARLPLPWLEDPHQRLDASRHVVSPVAFGPSSVTAAHRRCHAGTRDSAWARTRAPRLPLDFDPRWYNEADPRLQSDLPPAPGEHLRFTHLSARGQDDIVWPGVSPVLQVTGAAPQRLVPDTCVVCPDDDAFAIVWRTLVPPQARLTLQVTQQGAR
jgi:hypothetical protein